MFQAQNRETVNSTWQVAVSFEIIITTSLKRPCFATQHQTCKNNTKSTAYKTKTKTDFLVSDRSCPKTDGLRPHHWALCTDQRRFSPHCSPHQCASKLRTSMVNIIAQYYGQMFTYDKKVGLIPHTDIQSCVDLIAHYCGPFFHINAGKYVR